MRLERLQAQHPHDSLPPVQTMQLCSADFSDSNRLDLRHAHGSAKGENLSPNLRWSGAPSETQSYAVTCFDPDAPTGSGWWHWLIVDIPTMVTELKRGFTPEEPTAPAGTVELFNDFGEVGYGGAAPPPGDRDHRYIFTVHALDVPKLGLTPTTPQGQAGFNLTTHSLARGSITTVFAY